MNKQGAGFKYGVNRTNLIRLCGEVPWDGRAYKLALVEADGSPYYSIRLYNAKGKFIKQLMFEPAVLGGLIDLLETEELSCSGKSEL